MPSQWLAITPGVDPGVRARQLRQSWERLLAGRELKSEPPPGAAAEVRQAIVDSWKRSLDTGLDPVDLLAPLEADRTEMRERWAEHPLGSLVHVLLNQLKDIAGESQSLIVVSDASGLLLHIEGPETLRARAAEMNFVEGARYSEAAAGTNGIGTVLAADHALQVFASEHFNQRHHGWTCSGAPVHDPVSRRVLGVVDLSSPWEAVHPLGLELATTAARTLEQCLADARRDHEARLRRRYADLAARTTDLLASADGHVLAGDRLAAHPKPLAIPDGGGEILLGDGSVAAAEPLGQGEAYLVRRIGPCGFDAVPTEALERAEGRAHEQARGHAALRRAGDHGIAVKVESGLPSTRPGQRARAYFEAALDCVIMADASGRVVEFNPAAERTFGYTRDEALGQAMAELIVPPSLRERHLTAFARFIETRQGSMLGRRLELTGMRADGSEFPVELALSLVEAEPLLICGALRDISVAKQAEGHLRELAEEQAALRRVATLIARESSPQQLFAIVAEQVARIINVPLVRLVRYEPDGSLAELIGGWGESVDPLAIGTRWQLDGPGVLASVWQSGRPARFDDYTDVPGEAAAVVRQAGMRSAVASPISVEGRLWGAIAVLSPRHEPLPENTEARLADFTELVATAIANADSRTAIARLADEQAALRHVATLVAQAPASEELFSAVAHEVATVLNVPGVIVTRYEADGMAVVFGDAFESELSGAEAFFGVGSRAPADPGSLAAQVLETHGTARVDDFSTLVGTVGDLACAAGFRSGCAAPIVVNGELWGKLCVFSGTGTVLPARTEERLYDFIELVATAISNYEARAELAASEARALELANEQAALRRVATLAARESSPVEVLEAVAGEAARVLEVDAIGMLRFEPDETATIVAQSETPWDPPPLGTRFTLEGENIVASVHRTGHAARMDDWERATGSVAAMATVLGIRSAVASPIVVEGQLWGTMVAATNRSKPLPADTEARIVDFTELLATAIANADSRAELAASEARARELAHEQAALRRVATLVAQGASPDAVFTAVAEEVAGIINTPIVAVFRYESDGTCTTLGVAGETSLAVGSCWPVEEEGISGMILASGRPARKDDYSTMGGPVGEAVREAPIVATVGVPIVVEGSIWGFMVAGGRPDRPIPTDTEERLARFTELVATAVSNATMRGELVASRARVIAAADDARRRIERDLHDGAQQQLVTLALAMRSTEGRIPTGQEELKAEVGGFADRMTSVVEELREMSRGIHPAILSEGGLSPALEALALRSAVPVTLNVRHEQRLPDAVEAAAYYVASEALTNVSKHADASRVELDLHLDDASLRLSIRDDGRGGADPSRGSGLLGLKDRVEALGGTIDVESPHGTGTRLRVAIPVRADSSAG